MDTGADATLVPLAALVALGLQPIPDVTYELVAFDGTKSTANVADLDLIFLNRRFRGRYLLTPADTGVLGRDILNHLTLLFDAPATIGRNNRRPIAAVSNVVMPSSSAARTQAIAVSF